MKLFLLDLILNMIFFKYELFSKKKNVSKHKYDSLLSTKSSNERDKVTSNG